MDLKNLIEHLDAPRLSKDLDEVGQVARLWAVHQWTRAHMATLFEAAKGLRPITLDDFVPPSVEPLVQVVHHGKNSLPVFTYFEKRFCKPRPPADPGREPPVLVGYSAQAFEAFTGPGYYVARPSAEPGEVDLDHTAVPRDKAPGWPRIVPNSARLGRFAYAGLVDVMRGVSSQVTIGRSKKRGRWIDNWFVLVREDPPAAAAAAA